MPRFLTLLSTLYLLTACSGYKDTFTPEGTPNLVQVAPGLWRMGQPPTAKAWRELRTRIAPAAIDVAVIKLNDESEGTDYPAEDFGWKVARLPIPPEDGKPWSVLARPDRKTVEQIVQLVSDFRSLGFVVVWHCSHGRDRTGLISALVGMRLLGWSKDRAWQDMQSHGFRWELPALDSYWITEVPASEAPHGSKKAGVQEAP